MVGILLHCYTTTSSPSLGHLPNKAGREERREKTRAFSHPPWPLRSLVFHSSNQKFLMKSQLWALPTTPALLGGPLQVSWERTSKGKREAFPPTHTFQLTGIPSLDLLGRMNFSQSSGCVHTTDCPLSEQREKTKKLNLMGLLSRNWPPAPICLFFSLYFRVVWQLLFVFSHEFSLVISGT